MAHPHIVLVGYYGRGNFGDDVLLKVTHGILRECYPRAAFTVFVSGQRGGYLMRMLEGEVTVQSPTRLRHVDLIVHGGGGVLFDFRAHGPRARALEWVVRRVGFPAYVRLEQLLRALVRRPRMTASCRVGLGIGVGSFTPGSPKLREALPVLAEMDLLWVRDQESLTHLEPFASVLPQSAIIEGSDLAFLTKHWMPEPSPPADPPAAPGAKPRLGVILRDWPDTLGGMRSSKLAPVLAHLAERYALTGFVFEAEGDPETIAAFAPYPCHVWQPETMTMAAFCELLRGQDVLLTSRAHGAICGACLGVPSAILTIEPKLRQVRAMLPESTVATPPHRPEEWPAAIEAARALPADAIGEDVTRNTAQSEAALQQARARWLREVWP